MKSLCVLLPKDLILYRGLFYACQFLHTLFRVALMARLDILMCWCEGYLLVALNSFSLDSSLSTLFCDKTAMISQQDAQKDNEGSTLLLGGDYESVIWS